jgi:hypothetical protein
MCNRSVEVRRHKSTSIKQFLLIRYQLRSKFQSTEVDDVDERI